MKKCPNCGRVYSNAVTVCPDCKVYLSSDASGAATPPAGGWNPVSANDSSSTPPVIQTPPTPPASDKTSEDSGNFLWGVLGAFFPIVGWILWACWKKEKPKTAKVAATGAWIGFFLGTVLQFL